MIPINSAKERDDTPTIRLAMALFGLLMLVSGPICGYFLALKFLAAQSSGGWPTVAGTVIDSRIEQKWSGRETVYCAEIRYEYRVDDRSYTSTQITHFDGGGNSRRGQAEELVRRYPLNAMVTVYYQPDQPEQAVLEQGMGWSDYALLVLPVVMVGLGIMCCLGFWALGKQTAERRQNRVISISRPDH